MAASFDGFIGIDWSGATGKRYRGIAVAECAAGAGAPSLVPPLETGRPWTRTQVLDWLDRRIGQGGRLLIGIDCAFSLPFDTAASYFDQGSGTVFDLWDLVERVCETDPDLFGGAFPRHPAHASGYWTAGVKPDGLMLGRRRTEDACRADGLGSPESPYKLIGAKQVGKGALAGMRLLRAFRRKRNDVAVWPFEPIDGRSTVVEIYPRLFLLRTGWGLRKVRTWTDLNGCLKLLGSDEVEPPAVTPTDHDTDALVSAAGLRHLCEDPRVWTPAGLDERARSQEGWIFGVGAPVDHHVNHRALPFASRPATVPVLDPWNSPAVMTFSPAMLLAVAAGGAAGSVARFVAMSVIGQWFGVAFPYGTLAVNVIGSLVMGVLVEWWALAWTPAPELRALLAVGVLGGFTTFSTFSLDLVVLMQRGEMAAAALYMVVSVVFSVGALFAGLFLVRGIVG